MSWFPGEPRGLDASEETFLAGVRERGAELAAWGVDPDDTELVLWTGRAILEVRVPLRHGFDHRLHVGFLSGHGLAAEPSFDDYILDGAPGPWTQHREASATEAIDLAFDWFHRVLTAPLSVEHSGRSARLVLEDGGVLCTTGWPFRLTGSAIERTAIRP